MYQTDIVVKGGGMMDIQEQIECLRNWADADYDNDADLASADEEIAVTMEKLYAVYLAADAYVNNLGLPSVLEQALAIVREQLAEAVVDGRGHEAMRCDDCNKAIYSASDPCACAAVKEQP